MPRYPISTSCPKCGETHYKEKKSESYVAFLPDRVCFRCGTRYTPPTPRWAGGVFWVAGLSLLGVVAFFMIDYLKNGVGRKFPLDLVLIAVFGGITGMGAVGYGLKHLFFPERLLDGSDSQGTGDDG